MNDKELIGKVHSAVYHQCQKRGYAAPVDVLMDIGVLSKQDYENWRFGKVPFLERVCNINLSKLSLALHQMRSYAQKTGLQPSYTCYKRWGMKKKDGQGHRPVVRLRFSRSGDEAVERWYSTHFVDKKRLAEIKEQRKEAFSTQASADDEQP